MKIADSILVSDIHLRETIPVCRTDDLISVSFAKCDFIAQLQQEHDGCPVLNGGDLFEFWKASPWLMSKAIEHLPDPFYTICGQHDLPQNAFSEFERSSIQTLVKADRIKLLGKGHWEQKIKKADYSIKIKGRKILVVHEFNYQGKEPWKDCIAPNGKDLFKKYSADVILTGDNHQTFVREYKGRLLVNPGSMTRHKADQIDHKPCVFLYFAKTNTVKKVFIPIKKGVVVREHLEEKSERNDRIEAYVNRVDTTTLDDINFKFNIKKFFNKNSTKKPVRQIINKAFDKNDT